MSCTWRRAALALSVLLFTTATVGCGVAEQVTQRVAGPEWQEATSASGNYVAEFPGRPTTRTQTVPGSELTLQLTEVEFGGDVYTLSETELHGITPYPLDAAVDNSLESARAGQESSSGNQVTANELSRSTGDFEGVETRRFRGELVDGDKKATMSSLVFYRDDAIVQAIVVSNGPVDAESVDRFLSSLKPAN